MMQVDVKARPVITAEIKTQIDDSPIVKPANTDGIENLQLLNDAELNSAETIKSNTALAKEFGNIMPDVLKNFRQMNDLISKANQNLPAVQNRNLPAVQNKNLPAVQNRNFPAVVEKGLLAPINTGTSVIQSLGSGDATGAAVKGIQGTASTLKDVGSLADSAGIEGLGKAVAAVAMPLMIAGGVTLGVKALGDQYKKEMPNVFGTGRMFGATDDFNSMKMYQKLNDYNSGTGMDISEFNSAARVLRQSGVGNGIKGFENQVDAVGNIAQTTSRWAYATGGSAERYAELAGLMSRYGGSKDVSKDFNYLISSGKAMGLNDSQMPEFLSGIQKVMEDGIAKGFTRSSTDVANTLLMFSKISGGNQFWSGEQGARKLNQINSGISGATSLSKMEDVLVYSAFNDVYGKEGGSYIDVMEKMEQGLDAQTYVKLMEKLDARFGNDEDAKVEAVRNMTGLSYSASREMINLRTNGAVDDASVKKIVEAPENYNKETRWQESINKLAASMAKVGEGAFNVQIGGIDLISNNVEKIAKWLMKETAPAEIQEVVEKEIIEKAVSMGASLDDDEVTKAQKENFIVHVKDPKGLESGANMVQNQKDFVTKLINNPDIMAPFREMHPEIKDEDLPTLIMAATSDRSKKAEKLRTEAAKMGANIEPTKNDSYITKDENYKFLRLLGELLTEIKTLKEKGVNVNLTESK